MLSITLLLFSCGEPHAITKCKSLIGKKVVVNKDTLVIVNYNYSLFVFDDFNDEFILSNGSRISFYNVDKFLIN